MKCSGRSGAFADRLAIGASFVCVVHCLGLPLVFAALPAVAALLPIPEALHVWMVGFAVLVSVPTLIAGWRKHTGGEPLRLGLIGVALMIAGLFQSREAIETLLTVGGSTVLAAAHLRNLQCRPVRRG